MKKIAGDITLHKCTKNHNHMRYSSWDTEWDKQNFLSFWGIFCHFNTPSLEMSLFYTCVPQITIIMMYASWDMEYDRHNFWSFWAIFCLFTPLLIPKIKIWNKCGIKKHGDIILLHKCTINKDHKMHGAWDIRHEK